nr:reverse transcriptase domain-containing protein [Tanacetum cinerariifolium]
MMVQAQEEISEGSAEIGEEKKVKNSWIEKIVQGWIECKSRILNDKESLGEEDASKEGRISDIDANQDIYLVNVHKDEYIFGVNDQDDTLIFNANKDLQGKEVVVEKEVGKDVSAIKEVNAASIATSVTAITTTAATTPTISMDEITLAKALTEIKTSRPKAKRIVMQEPFHEEKKKILCCKKDCKKRNKPPTKAQQRSIMSTYLKNMDEWKPSALKNKSFAKIQELFNKAMKRINTFVDFRTELVKENDRDDINIDATPLFVKTLIVDYKIYKKRKKNYFQIFRADAKIERWAMPTSCHMFNSTLIGSARLWFDEVPPESIDSYVALRKAFLVNFLHKKKYINDPVEIYHIKQREGESTEAFMEHFKAESIHVKRAPECMRVSRFMHSITNPYLIKRLNENIPKSVDEIMRVTTTFLRGEVAVEGIVTLHRNTVVPKKSKMVAEALAELPPNEPAAEAEIKKSVDVTGVPRSIAEHRLNIRKGCPSIRQKERVIIEYLGKISEKAQILELKQRYFKDCYSDIQYAVSIKEDTAYVCLHSPQTTKDTSSICCLRKKYRLSLKNDMPHRDN